MWFLARIKDLGNVITQNPIYENYYILIINKVYVIGEWAVYSGMLLDLLIFGVLLFIVFRPRARWPWVLSGIVLMKVLLYYLVLPINMIPFLYVQLHDSILNVGQEVYNTGVTIGLGILKIGLVIYNIVVAIIKGGIGLIHKGILLGV